MVNDVRVRDLEINKLRKIDEVIFLSDKAKNVAIAKATARLFNEVWGKKNKFNCVGYYLLKPLNKKA